MKYSDEYVAGLKAEIKRLKTENERMIYAINDCVYTYQQFDCPVAKALREQDEILEISGDKSDADFKTLEGSLIGVDETLMMLGPCPRNGLSVECPDTPLTISTENTTTFDLHCPDTSLVFRSTGNVGIISPCCPDTKLDIQGDPHPNIKLQDQNGMRGLIEALQIFLKYMIEDTNNPTNCDHDVLYICVELSEISSDDIIRLENLGFFYDESEEVWCSFRYGSC